MKNPSYKVLRSLEFRIVAPIVVLMIMLGMAVNLLVLRSISNFADDRIREDLLRYSSEVYTICDNALQGLMTAGKSSNEVAIRVTKGKVLGAIESYAQQNNYLQVLVYADEGNRLILNTGIPPDQVAAIEAAKKSAGNVSILNLAKRPHYLRTAEFELWKWHIFLLQDGKTYDGLISEVQHTYAITAALLVIVCLLLVFYLKRAVQDPIKAVITSIQSNKTPEYKGIYEFEFLSDNIRAATEKQKEEQLKMSHQAAHDPLTGLVNRGEFEHRLEMALQNAKNQNRRHTVLYLDLDQFKIINDTCGHGAGDEMLCQVASLLQSKLRQSDTLARLGGDEFGILLEGCPLDSAIQVAESLRKTIADFRFTWQRETFSLSVSIGLVSFGDDGLSLSDVLSFADAACYVAKDGGRNRVHAYHSEDKQLAQRRGEMQWIGRIQKALDDNRFVLYMQRIAPLNDDDEKGEHYELLIRMLDEQGQLVPPMNFIPAAERYNLMPSLDRWVIKTTFAHFAKSPETLKALRLCAINLSGASVGDSSIFTFIREQFSLYQVPANVICFEITETSAIANMTKAATLVQDLKAIGCRFALDDFGSGMSSFTYLKHLPVDFLKIDGSFVKNMANDSIDCAMVEAINRIGHVIGLQTIAEFVENEKILQELRRIGVDFAQGYGIAKPCPFIEPHSHKISV